MTAAMDKRSPFEMAAMDYHDIMRAYQAVATGIFYPEWDELGSDQLVALFHFNFWTGAKIPQSPQVDHQMWIDLKKCGGWSWGADYSFIEKKHPMLKPFEECPRGFQIVSDIFFGKIDDYRPHLTAYLAGFDGLPAV